MRRCLLVAAPGWFLHWGLACSPVGGEPPPEPAPTVAVVPEPLEPRPEPIPPAAVEPESPTEPAPEPEPEPVRPPWSADDEPRIQEIQPLVAEAAAAHGVDPHLVNGVIWVESKFRPKAKNRSGARGLMQLMPKTAKALGRALKRPARVYDPEFNVHAGTYYLSRMLARFDGDRSLALAAYARGPGRVRAWVDAGEPFPAGVVRFVEKVEHASAAFEAMGWPEPEPELESESATEVDLESAGPVEPGASQAAEPQ
ncbi:lytic transglycosylase domain-containing protein [Paraliomyxa miuraensis]|uniref:lytic transglycosylase domain-containing protein n=1 Tax=Paraliomyxa miuraensis TaxID=376150 RepID=UPI00224DDFAD|nr:lytic transglycosylase domain-containing protein [Paraliomyxa miuraensis]MCX4242303.1 lytic transglycosylase domain-containing protein [Paraliomyxa miuraensis]